MNQKQIEWETEVRLFIQNHDSFARMVYSSKGEEWMAEILSLIAHGYERADRYEYAKSIGMILMDAIHDYADKEMRERS